MPRGTLTNRKAEVLRRCCAGEDANDVAFDLSIALTTVRIYLTKARRALGLPRGAALADACRASASPVLPSPAARPSAGLFTGFRIEYRAPGGNNRLLGESTVESVALASARGWARALRGKGGDVVVNGDRLAAPIAIPVEPAR